MFVVIGWNGRIFFFIDKILDKEIQVLLPALEPIKGRYYCQFINNRCIIQSRSVNQESDAFARHNDAVIFNSANVQ